MLNLSSLILFRNTRIVKKLKDKNASFCSLYFLFYHGTSYRLGRGQHPLIDNQKKNKNIIDVIDPFPDIFDTFDSLFFLFFLIIDHF